jgi:hypothetical protein
MYLSTMHDMLLQSLTTRLFWKKSRLQCLAGIIISLIENCSVSAKNMSLGIKNKAKHSSKHRESIGFLKINYLITIKLLNLF